MKHRKSWLGQRLPCTLCTRLRRTWEWRDEGGNKLQRRDLVNERAKEIDVRDIGKGANIFWISIELYDGVYFFLTCLFPYQAFQKHGPHLIYHVFLQSLLLCLVCGTFLVNVGFLIIKIIGCEIGEESLKKFYFPGNRGMVLIRHKRRTISDFQEVKMVFWPDWWDNYDAEIVRTDLSF